jgi:hypothetical protein
VRKDEQEIEPLLLKIRETARILNVSERHVENLAARGLLEKVWLDNAVRITRSSALKLAKSTAE